MNFYFEAAKVIDRLDAKQGSIKGILGTLPEKDRKRTAALVIETLKYKSVLLEVINQSKLLKEEGKKITSRNLALVLVHDVLLSKGIQAGDGPIKQAILRHKTRLNGELQKIKIKRGSRSNVDLAQTEDVRSAQIPRYVRVNTVMWSVDKAIAYYQNRGFTLSSPFESAKGFIQDQHIPNLLLFPSTTSFHDDSAYTSGKIILQDKASCFPAFVLNPPSTGATVIDATAAPGNKTSHLSAIMNNKGKLYAFERDRRRFKTLTSMLAKAGCSNVEPLNVDFLTVDPLDKKFHSVTHILLDPSCSGSGIINRLDYLLETEDENENENQERLDKLSAFQLMMIKHAMKFQSVQKIVYSTCSIHATENEHVAKEALKSDEAREGRFVLAPFEEVLPAWHRRGFPEEMDEPDHAKSVVRCLPGEDATNGFFVSCFIRERGQLELTVEHGHKRKADEAHDGGVSETGEQNRKKRKKKKKKPASTPE